jgi:hypothetical protein
MQFKVFNHYNEERKEELFVNDIALKPQGNTIYINKKLIYLLITIL